MSIAATPAHARVDRRGRGSVVAVLLAVCPLVVAQQPPASSQPGATGGLPASAEDTGGRATRGTHRTTQPLHERQQLVHDRWQRLEGRMLELARLLAESEPEKVERLRDALDRAGERDVKRRAEQLVALLRAERLGDAEREQEGLLADLEALLELLTSDANELDRRRAERERLQRYRRAIRRLMDEQTENLYRVGQAAESPEKQPAATADKLREIEQLQRQTQEKAAELHREMQQRAEQSQPPPGTQQTGRAADAMKDAADRIGERRLNEAQSRQQAALEQLQQALNEVDDALRQVRREEMEETLATLEARFKRMLEREKQVRDLVRALHEKGVANWDRSEQQQLAEAADTQRQVADDCGLTLRILLDEGTTVIVPELVRQLVGDMTEVGEQLAQGDASDGVCRLLDDIVELLEEIVAAIESKRDADVRSADEDGQGQPGDGSRALLPRSAELRLLRRAQIRINERTVALSAAGAPEAQDSRAERMERLSARQRRLGELAHRMHDRD